LKKNDVTKDIMESSIKSREFLIDFTDEIFETCTALIEIGQVTG